MINKITNRGIAGASAIHEGVKKKSNAEEDVRKRRSEIQKERKKKRLLLRAAIRPEVIEKRKKATVRMPQIVLIYRN